MAEKVTMPAALMADVPRGKAWDYVKAQTPPQARWQAPDAILGARSLDYDPRNPAGKILIGALGEKLIGIRDDRHIQTVAGNRSGKSVAVINNLFFYDGSVIAIDPKGELASITASARAQLGQRVAILDPFDIVTGPARRYRARYNLLSVIRPGNPFNVEDAVLITDGLVVTSGQEKDPHWNESAAHFLSGLCLWVGLGPSIRPEDRHLGTVRREALSALELGPDGETYALAERMQADIAAIQQAGDEDAASAIFGALTSFYDKPENEMAGVLSTLRRHTQLLDYRAMKDVLSGHDFDLADLKRRPEGMTLYLCLPAMRMQMCNRWLRSIVNQFLDAMERERTKPKSPVLAVLDEFPVLGHMKQLENAAGQIASFDVKLWTILQDWGQGKAIYKDRFESFAANAGLSVFFANVDLTTTEHVSKRLGKTLVTGLRKSDPTLQHRDQGLSGRSEAPELHDMLTPDEVARLFARSDPLKRQLVFLAGLSPMVIQRVEWWDKMGPLAGFV
ncbi:MAG: type IV secretory system conjugative DNA transfer family protein [Pseudomonadota bacterium]